MAQRNKLNRKAYARLCRALFWHKFEGATALPVRLLLLAQTKKLEQRVGVFRGLWRKSLLVAVGFTRLLRNGRLGSPKWNKQISLVNTRRRTVSQICLVLYLTCTSLNSNQGSLFIVTLEGTERSLNVHEVGYIWSLNVMSRSRDPLLTQFQI